MLKKLLTFLSITSIIGGAILNVAACNKPKKNLVPPIIGDNKPPTLPPIIPPILKGDDDLIKKQYLKIQQLQERIKLLESVQKQLETNNKENAFEIQNLDQAINDLKKISRTRINALKAEAKKIHEKIVNQRKEWFAFGSEIFRLTSVLIMLNIKVAQRAVNINQNIIEVEKSINLMQVSLEKFSNADQSLKQIIRQFKQKVQQTKEKPEIKKTDSEILANFAGSDALIDFSVERKRALDILRINPFTQNEEINSTAQKDLPFRSDIIKDNSNIVALRRFQGWQNHLYRVSKNSTQAYHDFANQVLNVNSQNFYNTPSEIIRDFKSVLLRDDVHVEAEWETIFKLSASDSQNIVNMYNYLIRFFDKENVKRWLFDIAVKDVLVGVRPSILAYVSFTSGYGFQHMKLKTDAFDAQSIASDYNSGWFSSNNKAATFIHEYGHALDHALRYRKKEMNMRYLPNKQYEDYLLTKRNLRQESPALATWQAKYPYANGNPTFEEKYEMFDSRKTIIKPSEEFYYFIGQKMGYERDDIQFSYNGTIDRYSFDIDNEASRNTFAFASMFADSRYGRTKHQELFAEIFAYWLWKPTVQKDYSKLSVRWTTINDFFLNYLPKIYHQALSA